MRSAPNQYVKSALVLLVDDNRDGVLARRCVLEELGYQVISAACGAEALMLIQQQQFDLIITDYKMSPMDGLQLISELRSRHFEKPIILLSGFAESIGLKAETTGANVVIQKSANEIATLVRQVSRLLNPKKPATSQRPSKMRAHTLGGG